MESVQTWLRVAMAAVMAVWHGLPWLTQLLLILMAADVFLGVAIALRDRTFDVHLARTGAARKVGSLVWLGLAAFLNGYFQPLMGINLVQAASAFYILPEFASVTKNSVLLGVPVFPQLQYILGYFEQVAGTKEKSSGDQTSTSTR